MALRAFMTAPEIRARHEALVAEATERGAP